MTDYFVISGNRSGYYLREGRELLLVEGSELAAPVGLDYRLAYQLGAALLPGESVWASPLDIFGSELLELLPVGSAEFGEAGELVVDPALIPPEGVLVWAPVPLRPYLEPVHLRRDALRFHAVFQWPSDGVSGASIPPGVGLFAGFGTPGETIAPASYMEAGLTRHSSNSTYIAIWTAAGSPNFLEQWQRNPLGAIAPGRFAWGEVEGVMSENTTQAINLYSRMSDAIDSEVFNGDQNVLKSVQRDVTLDWLNQELNSATTRFYLRLVGDPEWPHAPLKLHALCVR
ncbi:MAG: hypothetical protein CMM93_09155 [Rickettsiales bacterium]|nr:hypothetical protein [Rickettsiales bacterium]MAR57338.1 hypothetical protein [Rickettsiales bacterium]|tara:strand:+ start:850 stop:1707 length:858 start_codon:yes stop_codon:yes gene_type:complete